MFKNSLINYNLKKLIASNLTFIEEQYFTTLSFMLKLSKQRNHLANLNNNRIGRFIRSQSGGTCCDPCDETKVPKNQYSNVRVGNYNKKWVKDRFITSALTVAMPLALIYPTQIGDVFFISSVMMHQHWGIEGIVRDYAREIYYGKTKPKVAVAIVRCLSVVITTGLFYFTFTQCCIGESVRKFWSIKGYTSSTSKE